jgi:hypothetical protein
MNSVQDKHHINAFHEDELVTWHSLNGSTQVPIPAVVIRQEEESVIIKARIQDTIEEIQVNPDQLFHR